MAQSELPIFSIGAVLGDSDPESRAWQRSISALGKLVADRRAEVRSPVRLNVVFHVDGRLAPNEFEGVRVGRFDARRRRLLIQAAIPSGAQSDDRLVLTQLLIAALSQAESYVVRRGLGDDLNELRDLVNSLVAG